MLSLISRHAEVGRWACVSANSRVTDGLRDGLHRSSGDSGPDSATTAAPNTNCLHRGEWHRCVIDPCSVLLATSRAFAINLRKHLSVQKHDFCFRKSTCSDCMIQHVISTGCRGVWPWKKGQGYPSSNSSLGLSRAPVHRILVQGGCMQYVQTCVARRLYRRINEQKDISNGICYRWCSAGYSNCPLNDSHWIFV